MIYMCFFTIFFIPMTAENEITANGHCIYLVPIRADTWIYIAFVLCLFSYFFKLKRRNKVSYYTHIYIYIYVYDFEFYN